MWVFLRFSNFLSHFSLAILTADHIFMKENKDHFKRPPRSSLSTDFIFSIRFHLLAQARAEKQKKNVNTT